MSVKKWLVTAAAVVPAGYGLRLLITVWTLPKPREGAAHDGTPAIVGLFYLLLIAPVVALLSSLLISLLLSLFRASRPAAARR